MLKNVENLVAATLISKGFPIVQIVVFWHFIKFQTKCNLKVSEYISTSQREAQGIIFGGMQWEKGKQRD